ncbi:MAG: Mur ligase family protein, partial [Bacteroidota bacterium]
LETMGPIENIARVKGELVRHMKPGGPVILNGDDHRVLAMRDDAQGPVYTVSTGANPEADFVAGGISYGPDGARFLVRDTRSGEEAEFTTQLLGRHNVLNVLLAVAVGSHFGLRIRQMAYAAGRLEPVEHRLQLRQQGPLTVIDDAFNSNPVGARNAVEILGQFTTGRRILITPGMVELGERQETENQAFGTYAASHIDLALLVGDQQTRPIQTGLREAGFPEADLHVFDSLFDAQAYLNAHARPGDVVLYENDLPDQYG